MATNAALKGATVPAGRLRRMLDGLAAEAGTGASSLYVRPRRRTGRRGAGGDGVGGCFCRMRGSGAAGRLRAGGAAGRGARAAGRAAVSSAGDVRVAGLGRRAVAGAAGRRLHGGRGAGAAGTVLGGRLSRRRTGGLEDGLALCEGPAPRGRDVAASVHAGAGRADQAGCTTKCARRRGRT